MSKPAQNKDLKPTDDIKIGQTPSKPAVDTNVVVMVSTIIMIVVFLFTVFILKSEINAIKADVKKLSPTEEALLEEEEASIANQKGVLLDLGDFILNLADTTSKRYLKVNVALELSKTEEEIKALSAPAAPAASGGGHGHSAPAPAADPMEDIIAEMEQFKPAIRDAVISVLSGKTADELSSVTGKEIAKEEIQDLVSAIFNGSREVLRVNFAQFIIQ